MASFAPTYDEITKTADDLNGKAEKAIRAHEDAFGARPSPALLLNVLKAPINADDYPALFQSVAGSSKSRRARATNQETFGPNYQETQEPIDFRSPTLAGPSVTPQDIAIRAGDLLQGFFGGKPPKDTVELARQIVERHQRGEISIVDVYEITRADPKLQEQVARMIRANDALTVDPPQIILPTPGLEPVDLAKITSPEDAKAEREQYQEALAWSLERYSGLNREDLERQGVYIEGGALRALQQGGDILAAGFLGDEDSLRRRTLYQIGMAGMQMPLGTYAAGAAALGDARDLFTKGDFTPERLGELGKLSVLGMIEDFRNPRENPGYLLLDILGIVGGIAGGGARVGNTVSKARAATGAGATAKAIGSGLLTRPVPGQAVVMGEFVNLSENAAVRAAQKVYYSRADRVLRNRTGPNGVAYGAGPMGWTLDTPGVGAIDRLRRRVFSYEQTYQRARIDRLNFEIQQTLFHADRITRMAGGAVKAEKTMTRLLQNPTWAGWFRTQNEKTRLGIQKAMQVIGGDLDPDWREAVRIEREYHSAILNSPARIALIAGDVIEPEYIQRSHAAQLLALDEAAKVIESRDPRFVAALEETKAYADTITKMRVGLGLPEEQAADRIARYGAFMRGEPVWEVPDARGWIQAEIDKLNTTIASREGMVRGAPFAKEIEKRRKRLEALDARLREAEKADASAFTDRQLGVPNVEPGGTRTVRVERPLSETEARKRIADINKRLDKTLEKMYDLPPGWKQVLAKRNVYVGRLRREGKLSERDIQYRATQKYGRLPKEDALNQADLVFEQIIEKATKGKPRDEWHPTIRRVVDELDERNRLMRGLDDLEQIRKGKTPEGADDIDADLGIVERVGGREPTADEIGGRLTSVVDETVEGTVETPGEPGPAAYSTVAALTKARDRTVRSLERLEAKAADRDRFGTTTPVPEINRGLMGETMRGETIRRVESLQDALTDPRLDTDPATVLRELRVPFSEEPIMRVPTSLDAFFFSSQRAVKGRLPVPAGVTPSSGMGAMGIGPPNLRRQLPEMFYRFNGDSLLIGDYRVDVAALTAEAYKATNRVLMTLANYDRLWELSTDKPSRYSMIIRSIEAGKVSDEIRGKFKKLDDGMWNEEDAKWATDPAHVDLLATIFPGRVVNGEPVDFKGNALDLDDGSFRYVDERFFMDTPGQSSHLQWIDQQLTGQGSSVASKTLGGGLQAYNEVVRSLTLFLRTKYALNALSSAALQITQQGILMPVNLGRSLVAGARYGDDVARWLDGLAGQSRTQSLVNTRTPITRVSRRLSEGWTVLTDRYFRRAAVIHELRRQGIRSPDEMRAAMRSTDAGDLRKIREAGKRAERAMVEFDSLNPFEQNVLRHILFIYPWVRGSAVWSLRFMVDHPIQASVLAQIGRASEEEMDEMLGKVPALWERMGMFLTGDEDGDGNPTASSTSWLLPTNAFYEMARPWLSWAQGESPSRVPPLGSLGPTPELGVKLVTNRDEYGRPFEGPPVVGAMTEAFQGTALGSFLRKRDRFDEQTPLPEIDPADRRTFLDREQQAAKQPMFKLVSQDDITRSFLDPFYEPTVNKEALNARGWMETARTDPEAWHKHQMDMIYQGLQLQSDLVGEPLPLDVVTAAKFVDERSWILTKLSREQGRAANARQRAEASVEVMVNLGIIDKAEAEDRMGRIRKAGTQDGLAMKDILTKLNEEAGGFALSQWDRRVRTVVQFRDQSRIDRINESLTEATGTSYPGMVASTREDREQYGRLYVQFTEQYHQLIDESEDPGLSQDEQDAKDREIRDWLAANDEDVMVNGKPFPSLQRVWWASLGPNEKIDYSVDLSKRSVDRLSSFDRELLDLPGDSQQFVQAWQAFEERVDRDYEAQRQWDPSERYSRREIEVMTADKWEKALPGFRKEWEVATGPKVLWLERLPYFKTSPNKDGWETLFGLARKRAGWLVEARQLMDQGEESPYELGEIQDRWRTYVRESLYAALPAPLKAEVNDFGGLDWIASWLS